MLQIQVYRNCSTVHNLIYTTALMTLHVLRFLELSNNPSSVQAGHLKPSLSSNGRMNIFTFFPAYLLTSSFARFNYSECGLRSLRSLTHMGVMRQGGNVAFL